MESGPVIVWFRRDLRMADNPALLHAAQSGRPVVPVYVSGWEDGETWGPGRAARWWLDCSLERLAASLAAHGAPLRILPGPAQEEIPRLVVETAASVVAWNRLHEPHVRRLDGLVAIELERAGALPQVFDAALLFEPDGHLARSGRPFTQFTAFWRSCRSLPEPPPPCPGPSALPGLAGEQGHHGRLGRANEPRRRPHPYTVGTEPWEPGEAGANVRLERFLDGGLAGYESSRDLFGVDGTSRLSPHLHFGEIGPRQVWHAVKEAAEAGAAGAGADAFLRQLGWREFAHYLLFHFPRIVDEPFRPEFARFPWADDPDGFVAWTRGETGYPLVDAAMRQLLDEGWMHNRARMVAASFLTKDLLIPWQQGAAWFWDRLVDADLANNSLGWQWTAGSGPDAAPYFRIFNPGLQARRFDPKGAYVGRWAPDDEGRRPIVDHAEARARALAAFRGIRQT